MSTITGSTGTDEKRIHPAASEGPITTQRLYRLSVEQYDQLARAGVLTKKDRVELIEGLLVEKMTKNERHLTTTWMIQHLLNRGLPPGWFAVTESPIRLARSEPEPDVLVLRGRIQDYQAGKPRPEHLALVVEVADSSYLDDASRRRLYAEAGIPFYWIAHIPADRIEVYSDPTGLDPQPDYRTRHDYGRGDEIPVILDGRDVFRLRVEELLPAPRNP